jgi:hypothetical protein
MVSLFLEEIETYLALEPAGRAKPTPLFFIFHLLGEWREKAAYRSLARLLRLPRRDVDAIFGDGITTTSHRVMASVFERTRVEYEKGGRDPTGPFSPGTGAWFALDSLLEGDGFELSVPR